MASGTPMSILKPILIVGALAAIGMGGYNLATTGCPLGTCDAPAQSTTMTSVSGVDSSAPSDESSACARKVAPVQLTGLEDGESGSMGCCGDKPADSAGKEGCSMGTAQVNFGATQSDGTTECPMSATKVDFDPNHCEDKDASECEKSYQSDSELEQTADTEQIETGTSEG